MNTLINRVLIITTLISLILVGCGTTGDKSIEEIKLDSNKIKTDKFRVLDEAKFQINEFVKETYIEMSMLTGTNIAYGLPKYFGDAGSLYDDYTLPTLEKLYISGLLSPDFKVSEQGVAVVKVFAYYPQDIQSLERGSQFDCFVISTGNASNITRGKIFRTGLTDSRFPSEDYYAVVEGSLSELKNIEEDEDLKRIVPDKLIDKFKVSDRSYSDGTEHQPRVYYWKNGVKLIKKPPRNRNAEPVIRYRLNSNNDEIIDGIKQSICELLPLLPNEIKTDMNDSRVDILINLPIGYQIEPYSFAEQLKQKIFTVSSVRKSYVLYDKEISDITFLGKVPSINKTVESKMIIQEGANSAPYVVIPTKIELNDVDGSGLPIGPSSFKYTTELRVMVDEYKTKKYIIDGNSCLQIVEVLNKELGYGALEILNFFKQAIVQDAIDLEIIERSMYFVYNQDKTAKFYPENNLIAFGNTILDVKIKYKEIKDIKDTETNEAETLIDLEIPFKNAEKIMKFATSLPSIDNSVFYIIDKNGKRKKYRILISDSELNKLSDAKIDQILSSDASFIDRYYNLFNEITKLARLTARIEMQVGKIDDDKTNSASPNENNTRTIRISKYFINKAIEKLEQAKLKDFDKDILFETHRNAILDKTNIVPQVPMRIFAMIKEEKFGLAEYPFFKDFLRTIDLSDSEWKKVISNRLEFIKKSVESDELNETDKKKAVIREIEAHRKIPFFAEYVQQLQTKFDKYFN